jgi:SSS family solute:Na+ symporter
MMLPLQLLIALSGWVAYRYRETRAMTLAQFFQMRYSRNFRVFAGVVGWLSGVINFGIFPAVGARFFVYFCGFPTHYVTFLGVRFDVTFASIMIFLLSVSLFFVFLGGQIAVMVTDFIQGMFVSVVFLVILFTFFWMFDWPGIVEALKSGPANPDTQSMINPMKTATIEGFNAWYYIIGAIGTIYFARAWQGSQGYNCSAKNAHEAKMSGILGEWRGLVLILVTMLLPIGAYVVMHHPRYVEMAAGIQQTIDTISANDGAKIGYQMTVPVVLVTALPIGIKGMLAAVMLAAFISTHDTYLHSWGAIFVQDVILPFRRKPFSTKQHFWLLRLSILFVAVFIFFFSLLFQQNEFILHFFAITGAIYLGGAGAVIIGGLYWKHGSTSGAWVALGGGATFAILGLIMRQTWPGIVYPWLENDAPTLLASLKHVIEGVANAVPGINWTVGPKEFPFLGQWWNLFTIVICITGYVSCSLVAWLVFHRPAHNMDRLLHRGRWAIKGEHVGEVVKPVSGLRAILPTSEFSFWDKVIYYSKLAWTFGWWGIFLVGTLWGLGVFGSKPSDDAWVTFWWWKVWITVVIGVGTTIWFFFGGIHDMKDLFHTLRTMKRDMEDIGMVSEEHDPLDEEVLPADVLPLETPAVEAFSEHALEPETPEQQQGDT